jgi:hypothetical protein
VSSPRIAVRARIVVRVCRVLQCISRLLGSRTQSWLQKGCKILSEKLARRSEKIAGIGRLPH